MGRPGKPNNLDISRAIPGYTSIMTHMVLLGILFLNTPTVPISSHFTVVSKFRHMRLHAGIYLLWSAPFQLFDGRLSKNPRLHVETPFHMMVTVFYGRHIWRNMHACLFKMQDSCLSLYICSYMKYLESHCVKRIPYPTFAVNTSCFPFWDWSNAVFTSGYVSKCWSQRYAQQYCRYIYIYIQMDDIYIYKIERDYTSGRSLDLLVIDVN